MFSRTLDSFSWDDAPSRTITDPDEVNEWLVSQGALTAKNILRSARVTHLQAVWSLAPKDDVLATLELLKTYSCQDSRRNRLLSGCWNRSYLVEVTAVTKGSYASPGEILTTLLKKLPQTFFEKQGVLYKILSFIRQKLLLEPHVKDTLVPEIQNH